MTIPGNETSMSIGAKALMVWIISGVIWDIWKPDQTLSAAAARALADPRTRYPAAATLVLVIVHLIVMARAAVVQPRPQAAVVQSQPPQDLHLERFEILRAIGFPA